MRSWAYPRSRGATPRWQAQSRVTGAYPRSRGATFWSKAFGYPVLGLSPLARGNLSDVTTTSPVMRPIPARAGQPAYRNALRTLPGAYPRSRGATGDAGERVEQIIGLSPLARGNPRNWSLAFPPKGPIPARAGQPRCSAPH